MLLDERGSDERVQVLSALSLGNGSRISRRARVMSGVMYRWVLLRRGLTVALAVRLLAHGFGDDRVHVFVVLRRALRLLAQEPSAVVDTFSKKKIHLAAE